MPWMHHAPACTAAAAAAASTSMALPLLLPPALQSYHRFMREHLFDQVDIPPEALHIPDGTAPLAEVPR